jgi:hypothetical protein
MPKAATSANSGALRAAGFGELNAFINRVIERRYYRSEASSTNKAQSIMRRSPLLRHGIYCAHIMFSIWDLYLYG